MSTNSDAVMIRIWLKTSPVCMYIDVAETGQVNLPNLMLAFRADGELRTDQLYIPRDSMLCLMRGTVDELGSMTPMLPAIPTPTTPGTTTKQ